MYKKIKLKAKNKNDHELKNKKYHIKTILFLITVFFSLIATSCSKIQNAYESNEKVTEHLVENLIKETVPDMNEEKKTTDASNLYSIQTAPEILKQDDIDSEMKNENITVYKATDKAENTMIAENISKIPDENPTDTGTADSNPTYSQNEETQKINSGVIFLDRSFVKTYSAIRYADVIARDYAAAPELVVFNQEQFGGNQEDVQKLLYYTEKFIYLTDNTVDRNTYEIGNWSFLTTAECWRLIDEWGKKSTIIGTKTVDVIFGSEKEAQVNVLLYVNDNHFGNVGNYIEGYSGEINNVSGFAAQFLFKRTDDGWYLYNEAYPDFDPLKKCVVRAGGAPVSIADKK